jgi:hypothetical protein
VSARKRRLPEYGGTEVGGGGGGGKGRASGKLKR